MSATAHSSVLPAVDRDVELLLETALRPRADAALSWARWKERNNLDDVGWEQHRTLALIAPRLADIDPGCEYLPRVKGLAKASWTKTQIQLQASTEALDVLAAAGIPVLFMKGAAFLAAGYRHSAPRISGDLDVLVPRAGFAEAVRALYDAGWRSAHSVEYASNHWRFQPGLNLLHGKEGDIDVHHQPVRSRWLSDAVLDRVWQRARPVTFRGRHVFVPSVSDMVVSTSADAIPDNAAVSTGAWALDLQLLLDQPDFDPAATAKVAGELGASANCLAAMRLLQNLKPTEQAKRLIEALTADPAAPRPLASPPPPPGRWTVPIRRALRPLAGRVGVPNTRTLLALYAGTPGSRLSRPLRRLASRFASVDPDNGFESEYAAVPALPEQKGYPARMREAAVAPSLLVQSWRHTFDLAGRQLRDRFLIVAISFERPPVNRRCRLEVIAEGRPVGQPMLWRTAATPSKRTAIFAIPLALIGASKSFVMESVADELLHGTLSDAVIARTEAIRYAVERLAWC